jgi:hypothetical protein
LDDTTPGNRPWPEPENDAGGVSYWGAVVEVTKGLITIQFAGDKPKRFPVSETLAAGKVPKEPRPIPGRRYPYHVGAAKMYRLTDVKVGDLVVICYSKVSGVVICDHICIQKRPGGLVPPLPEEAEALRRPKQWPGIPPRPHIAYHELMNAHWDLEDKGIPYPESFATRGFPRRWPEAPPPREVRISKPRDNPLQ